MLTGKHGRGRPAGTMTHRRHQVLAAFEAQAIGGTRVSIARLVRECHLHDRSSALRIIRDLKRMGKLAALDAATMEAKR